MSPRAAWRLEQLGFGDVYDYVPGKMDWIAFDLPYEGEAVLVGSAVDRDVPTCRLDDQVGSLAVPCIVVGGGGVVMGMIDDHARAEHPDATAGAAMRFGVTTVRPSEDLAALVGRMEARGVETIVVTRQDGFLVGLLRRSEAAHHLHGGSG